MHEASHKVLRLRLLSTMLGIADLHAFVTVFRKHVSGSTNKAVSLIVQVVFYFILLYRYFSVTAKTKTIHTQCGKRL